MSTTRIVFMIVCIVLAAILIFFGIIFQRNDPDGKYSMANIFSSAARKRRKGGFRLPPDSRIWVTVALAIFAIVLLLVFSKK